MLGYYKNEKSTKETLTSDGWLMTGASGRRSIGFPLFVERELITPTGRSTGDICTRDNDGWYRVIDRNKDLIKYKGASDDDLPGQIPAFSD